MRCGVPSRAWIGAVIAALASTGCDGYVESETIESALYLVNFTHADVALEVYRPLVLLDCETIGENPEGLLDTLSFTFDRCLTSEPFLALPLDTDWVVLFDKYGYPIEPKSPAPTERVCDAVVVSTPKLGARAVFWNDVPKVVVERIDQKHRPPDPHALYLEGFGDRLVMAASRFTNVWDANRPSGRESCP